MKQNVSSDNKQEFSRSKCLKLQQTDSVYDLSTVLVKVKFYVQLPFAVLSKGRKKQCDVRKTMQFVNRRKTIEKTEWFNFLGLFGLVEKHIYGDDSFACESTNL